MNCLKKAVAVKNSISIDILIFFQVMTFGAKEKNEDIKKPDPVTGLKIVKSSLQVKATELIERLYPCDPPVPPSPPSPTPPQTEEPPELWRESIVGLSLVIFA